MHSVVKKVFGIIAVCTASLLLWGMVFVTGRPAMWGAIEPAMQKNWSMYTFSDGKLVYDSLTEEFDKVSDISTR